MYFYHKQPKKEKCHLQKAWDLMITQLINHSYRLKATMSQVLKLRGIWHSPQHIQRLVFLELLFGIYLQECLQWALASLPIFYFVLILLEVTLINKSNIILMKITFLRTFLQGVR